MARAMNATATTKEEYESAAQTAALFMINLPFAKH